MILIDKNICVGCGRCVVVCPEDALSVWGICTFSGKCIECLTCIENCPVKAIREGKNGE